MGLGKGAYVGEILSWPSNSMWGGVACMLDAHGRLCECGDTPQTLAGLMYLFGKLCIAHCGKEGKYVAATLGWPPLWAIQLPNGGKHDYQQFPNLEETVPVWDNFKTLLPQATSGFSTCPKSPRRSQKSWSMRMVGGDVGNMDVGQLTQSISSCARRCQGTAVNEDLPKCV